MGENKKLMCSKLLLENKCRRKVNKTKEHFASIDGYKHNLVSLQLLTEACRNN